jgi:hypothetical protein
MPGQIARGKAHDNDILLALQRNGFPGFTPGNTETKTHDHHRGTRTCSGRQATRPRTESSWREAFMGVSSDDRVRAEHFWEDQPLNRANHSKWSPAMRIKMSYVTTRLAAGAAAAAIAAPMAMADPASPQSCTNVGQNRIQCQTPGNGQNDSQPDDQDTRSPLWGSASSFNHGVTGSAAWAGTASGWPSRVAGRS